MITGIALMQKGEAMIQIDIPMPKGCWTCNFYQGDNTVPRCVAKSRSGRIIANAWNLGDKKQAWCPLISEPTVDALDEAYSHGFTFAESRLHLTTAQHDDRLNKIEELVDGTIDHFDRDDAMDLLYQIKEVLK